MNVPRKPIDIPKEELDAVEQGQATAKDVSTKYNISQGTVYNKIKKGKLNVSFTSDAGDKSPPTLPNVVQEQTNVVSETNDNPEAWRTATKGFWSMIDMAIGMLATFTKKFTYERLTEKDLDELAEMTFMKIGKYIQGNMALDIMATVGFIAMKFGTRIKGIPKEEKDKIIAGASKAAVEKRAADIIKEHNKSVVESSKAVVPEPEILKDNKEGSALSAAEPTKTESDVKHEGLPKKAANPDELDKLSQLMQI